MSTEVENLPIAKDEKENIATDSQADEQQQPQEHVADEIKKDEEGEIKTEVGGAGDEELQSSNKDETETKVESDPDPVPVTTTESDQKPDEKENELPQIQQRTHPKHETSHLNSAMTAVSLGNTDGIPKELLVKHPLQYRWVLWYCKQDRAKTWEECLKEVASFDTVEDFWALYNHIQLASGLSWGSDYYLFKEGIQPMWEDTHNREGGRWLIQIDKNRRAELIDHYWLELLMAVIGEQFDDFGEYICGLVINIRQKGDKISLWTRDATKEDINKRIGSIAKQKLGMNDQQHISYEGHNDTKQKNSSNVKALCRV